MARRALNSFLPLLVVLVAVAIGFLTIGTSFAGTTSGPGVPPGGVAPVDGTIPPSGPVPAHTNDPGTIHFGPKDCPSCMEPPRR
jgi:hypothetical protein